MKYVNQLGEEVIDSSKIKRFKRNKSASASGGHHLDLSTDRLFNLVIQEHGTDNKFEIKILSLGNIALLCQGEFFSGVFRQFKKPECDVCFAIQINEKLKIN